MHHLFLFLIRMRSPCKPAACLKAASSVYFRPSATVTLPAVGGLAAGPLIPTRPAATPPAARMAALDRLRTLLPERLQIGIGDLRAFEQSRLHLEDGRVVGRHLLRRRRQRRLGAEGVMVGRDQQSIVLAGKLQNLPSAAAGVGGGFAASAMASGGAARAAAGERDQLMAQLPLRERRPVDVG